MPILYGMAHGNEAALRPAREQVWREAARAMGATFEGGDFWSSDALTLECPPWTIRATVGGDVSAALTLVRASFEARRRFRLTLLRGAFERGWPGVDLAPLAVGGPKFIAGCTVTASDSLLAHALLARPGLRARLLREPHLGLAIRHGALTLAVVGVVGEEERLCDLFATAAELLHGLKEQKVA